MKNTLSKINFAVLSAALFTLQPASTAHAHATLDIKEAHANSYQRIAVRVPHGCEGQPTQTVSVSIPEGIVSVKPMPKAGWNLETVKGDYDNDYELHGRTITSGVKQLIWSDGSLKDDHFDEFVFQARLTDRLPSGAKVFLPVVQHCKEGKQAWVEIPAKGQDPHELKRPAPGLLIKASMDAHKAHGKAEEAQSVKIGDLEIVSPMIRATPPKAPVSGGYMVIKNHGSEPDRLIGGSASFAGKVEVHEMKMDGDVMKMREIEGGLEIPAGGSVTLKPGGLHVMFMKLTEQMNEGETRTVTLEFEKAGSVEMELPVKMVKPGHSGKHNH